MRATSKLDSMCRASSMPDAVAFRSGEQRNHVLSSCRCGNEGNAAALGSEAVRLPRPGLRCRGRDQGIGRHGPCSPSRSSPLAAIVAQAEQLSRMCAAEFRVWRSRARRPVSSTWVPAELYRTLDSGTIGVRQAGSADRRIPRRRRRRRGRLPGASRARICGTRGAADRHERGILLGRRSLGGHRSLGTDRVCLELPSVEPMTQAGSKAARVATYGVVPLPLPPATRKPWKKEDRRRGWGKWREARLTKTVVL